MNLHPTVDPVELNVVEMVKNWESTDLKKVFYKRAKEAYFFKFKLNRVFTVVMHFKKDAILLARVE